MVPQEVVLSTCSTAGALASKASSTPAIQLHDLATFAHVHSFKSASNATNCLAISNSDNGIGGTVWSVQEGKAIACIWAWQKVSTGYRAGSNGKDQQHLKLHLPERLACLVMSPNRVWVAGGSPTGQIYLWEVSEILGQGS
jgi:pre-rRNA-processing protein IPI3